MTFPAFVIHLERAEGRQANARSLCQIPGLDARIVPAVDFRADGGGAFEAPSHEKLRPRYPFEMKPAEIATFRSHRRCWQMIVEEGHPAALVLEDDVTLGKDFWPALDLVRAHLPSVGLVRLPQRPREKPSSRIAAEGGHTLFRPRVIGLGMMAYVVTQKAAGRLLEATEHFDRPVDVFLQMRWVHRVDVLSVWPCGVREISSTLGGSTIHEPKRLKEILRHECRRPVYRLLVRLLAVRHRHAP